MQFTALLGYATKWTLRTMLIGYITYACHEDISRIINKLKFYYNKVEVGFVEKDFAFDINVIHTLNSRGRLETYVEYYSQNIPVYGREDNFMVGSAEQNFAKFTKKEKRELCRK